MALKKPSDFFEEKKIQEQLQQEVVDIENEVKKVNRLKSPSDLFDPKPVVEEYFSVEEEVINEEVQVDPIVEIRTLIEEVRQQIPEIPQIKTYDEELDSLREEFDKVYHIINQSEKPKFYDEDIELLERKIDSIRFPKVKYYDQDILDLHEKIDGIKIPEIPEIRYYDQDIINLYEKIEGIKIPEVKYYDAQIYNLSEDIAAIDSKLSKLPKVKYYDQDISDLYEKIDNIEIPEVRYYENEISFLQKEIENVRSEIPEIKYYDEDIQKLHQKIDSIEIPEIPEVKYYDKDISELHEKIDSIEIPEIPEIRYYDEDIKNLKINIDRVKSSIKEPKFYDEEIKSLRKIIREIKNTQETLMLSEGLLNEPPESDNKDPLTPTNQNFATLEDLQNHYRIFINRVQQQLATIGGGGETRLEFLDDVDRASAKTHGYVLSYDSPSGKFIGIPVSGGGGTGIATYANVAGIATYATTAGVSTYSSTAGIATYATTAGISTYSSTAGIASNATLFGNQLPSYYLDYTNLTNKPTNLSQFTNNVGFITSSALIGYATETYVNVAIANLVNSAPATLDTLKELADALGDDPNFSVTITNSLSNKLSLSGGVVSGIVTASGFVGNLTGNATSSTYATTAGVSTYSSTSGISTVSQGLTGSPNVNVGITTASRLIVGAGTTFAENLVVEGNARVTGILTIGTASVTIDGDNNIISTGNVLISGSSVTIGDNVTINAGATGINSAPNVLYVAKDGNDSNNGTTIDNAKLTIAGAVAIAQTGTTIKVLSGTYNENNPIEVPPFVSIVGDNLKTVTVVPINSTQDIFHVNKGTYLAHMTFTGHVSPAAAVAFPPSIAENTGGGLWESPYVQNCTSNTTTGTGMRIDGNLAEGLKSMVVDAYTQYNQGGVGIAITNGGYAQLVSVFTICCNESITVHKGGQCSLANSNTSFGTFGLVADGISDLQFTGTASTSTAGTNTIAVAITTTRPYEGQVVYFGTLYQTVRSITITDGGSGYTTTPSVSISAPTGPNGITATAFATLNGDKVSEITVVSSGTQYTEAPVITISAPDSGSTATASANMDPIYYTINSSTPVSSGISTITIEENLNNTVSSGTTVYFYQLSKITASSHTFEYVGSGNDITTATPLRGGVAIQENEIVERNGGKVVYTSTDQSGNFRIGNDIVINQNNGTITGRAFTRSLFNQMTPFILALS